MPLSLIFVQFKCQFSCIGSTVVVSCFTCNLVSPLTFIWSKLPGLYAAPLTSVSLILWCPSAVSFLVPGPHLPSVTCYRPGPVTNYHYPPTWLWERSSLSPDLAEAVVIRHVQRSQKDPRSWIFRIQDTRSWRILDPIFSFSLGS